MSLLEDKVCGRGRATCLSRNLSENLGNLSARNFKGSDQNPTSSKKNASAGPESKKGLNDSPHNGILQNDHLDHEKGTYERERRLHGPNRLLKRKRSILGGWKDRRQGQGTLNVIVAGKIISISAEKLGGEQPLPWAI